MHLLFLLIHGLKIVAEIGIIEEEFLSSWGFTISLGIGTQFVYFSDCQTYISLLYQSI